jgi:hypothetical protein
MPHGPGAKVMCAGGVIVGRQAVCAGDLGSEPLRGGACGRAGIHQGLEQTVGIGHADRPGRVVDVDATIVQGLRDVFHESAGLGIHTAVRVIGPDTDTVLV